MSSQPDFVRTRFGPLREKTLRNALAHRIAKEFPRIGGRRICQLCADMILEVVFKQMRSKDHVVHGQVLWMAVSVNDPPRRRQPWRMSIWSLSFSTSPPPTMCNGVSSVFLLLNGCYARRSAFASRRISREDCSPTAISPSCSVSLTTDRSGADRARAKHQHHCSTTRHTP